MARNCEESSGGFAPRRWHSPSALSHWSGVSGSYRFHFAGPSIQHVALREPLSLQQRCYQASRINASSSSAEIFPLMSAPASRLSARSRFDLCMSTIFSSIVLFITSL